MPQEHQVIRKLFAKLIRARRTKFPPRRTRLDVPSDHGVYVIYGPTGRVRHVGRTVSGRNGLRQRLNDHLQCQSSFTLVVFRRKGSKLRGTHSYACVEVRNDRRRALLEAYAVGKLCPEHLGTGMRVSSRHARRKKRK